jgi:DNA-directed RNA polymerase subunit F
MAHLLMYLNGKGISFTEVEQELSKRSHQQKTPSIQLEKKTQTHLLGFMGGKHFEKIDAAAENLLGIKVLRPSNRSLKLTYEITDPLKY